MRIFISEWIKLVLLPKMNYLFDWSNTALMSEWKSTIFELVKTTLTSSVKGIDIVFPIKIFSKLLIYVRKNMGLGIDPCGTPCFIFIRCWTNVGSMKCILCDVCAILCKFHTKLLMTITFIHSFENWIKFCTFHFNSTFCYGNISAKCFLLGITLPSRLEKCKVIFTWWLSL